ncbi:transcription factor MYBS3-like [Phragmites australis]|uniref:transcription factor MYBS3-like n=1 Tax=Phragmites australis TaxID=29695 RepID=UPI002D7986A9|nr:transcription factor MYBS3-like [Phragmites australis]
MNYQLSPFVPPTPHRPTRRSSTASMPHDSRPAGMRLFGVTIAPAPPPALEVDPADRRSSPNPPLAARETVMRKCKSMGNLAAAGSGDGGGAGDGYLSDGGLMQSSGKRRRAQERKKAVPWTEEEHRTFLAGLEKLGKGDWRGIAKKFVTTRTPTQVASHAQKFFLRQTNPNKKKRRASLFDMMPGELSEAPNCPILPPSMAKVHDVVAMTKLLQNSNLEGVSSSNAYMAPQVGRDLSPVPSFKATNMDSSFRKLNHMERFWKMPFPFRPIPRSPEGTSSSTPATANIAAPASQAFLSLQSDSSSSPPPKADPPTEKKDLELTVAPPFQQTMTNISSQNAFMCMHGSLH